MSDSPPRTDTPRDAEASRATRAVDLSAARAYIAALTGSPDTPVTFQTFDDTKMKRKALAYHPHGTLDDLAPTLDQRNQRRVGVFVTVNETDLKGRETANVKALRSLFIDCDGIAPTLALAPSFTVRSSHGNHHYWLLQPGEALDAFGPAQKHLAEFYGSDTRVKDLPRVMRLPGFNHHKAKPPFRVTFEPGTGLRYTVVEVLAAHPLAGGMAKASRSVTMLGPSDGSIPEGHRETTILRMLGAARRQGARYSDLLALAVAINLRCIPPLEHEALERLAARVAGYEAEPDRDAPEDTREDDSPAPEDGADLTTAEEVGQAWEAMKTAMTTPPPSQFWSLGDLWKADVPAVEGFLADQILARQTVNLLAGRRSAGKTYLVLKLMQSIARGEFFGHLKTRKGRVLLISQEMPLGGIVNRIRKLLNAEEAAAFERQVQVACKLSICVDSNGGADQLRQLIELAGCPDVVIIDALRDIKGGAAEDSNDDMGALFGRLRDLVAVPTNSCLIVIHHKGKPSDTGTDRGGRGASAIEDVCADVIYLDMRKGGVRVGSFAKSRDDVADPFTFTLEDAKWPDGTARLVVKIEDTARAEEDEAMAQARKAADFVGDRGEALVVDVMKKFDWSRTAANRWLGMAEEKEWISRDPDRKGGESGRSTVWIPGYTVQNGSKAA